MARFTVARMMIVVAGLAVVFAWVDPWWASIAVVPVFVVAFGPHFYRWRTLEIAGALLWLICAAWVLSGVGLDLFDAFFLGASGSVLGFSWLLRLCVARQRPVTRRDWEFLLVTPMVGLLGFTLGLTDWDFRVRLFLSEPALRASARSCLAGANGTRRAGNVGLFPIQGVHTYGGCVLWKTKGGGFLDMVGLAYSPLGPPPRLVDFRFQHVQGPWWRYVQRF